MESRTEWGRKKNDNKHGKEIAHDVTGIKTYDGEYIIGLNRP